MSHINISFVSMFLTQNISQVCRFCTCPPTISQGGGHDFKVGDRVQVNWKQESKIFVYGVVKSVSTENKSMVVLTDKPESDHDARPQDGVEVTIHDRTNVNHVTSRGKKGRFSFRQNSRLRRVNYSQV